jgi:DNA helicase II / ATP-dependent DNA helicase PcrA
VSRSTFTPTDEQRELIAVDDGSFLVIAPPGSGKTTVLTERVARLVANPAETFRVLALTFTNKAAGNMRNRLFESVGEHSSRVTASTIHSFCLEALRNYGDAVGVGANVSIYENEDDRVAALVQGLIDEGIHRDGDEVNEKALRRILASIGALKRGLIAPDQAPQTVEEGIVPLGVAYAAYDRTLRLFGAVDFDDILFFAFRLFSTVERVVKQYRRVYRYVVVDEAQDMNTAQYEVLRALCSSSLRNVMLVADADQSIFRFAGATTTNLLRFEQQFGGTRLGLTQNFRCAEKIVTAANILISKNPSRITCGAEMTSAVLATGHIAAASYRTEAVEAEATLRVIDEVLEQGLDSAWCYAGETTALVAEDICILGRSRYVLGAVLDAMVKAERPFQFSAGRDGLFESEAFAAFEASLRLLQNPGDLLARRSLKRQGTGSTSEPVEHAASLASLVARLPGWWRRAIEPLLSLQTDASTLGGAIAEVVKRVRAAAFVDDEERATALADADALEKRWAAFHQVHRADATVARFLGDIALAGRGGIDGPGVRVLTIHAAKGLEFRVVVLVGMNEGSFPDYRSTTVDEIADERRNAYVAITRAERALFVSRPRSRLMPWGDPKAQQASRFLAEANIRVDDVA